ncbi:hypothetical protein L198_08257 [Cryptococcus wingfieldii CBS 7118]|uniref:Transcriptional coactivator HFI1/ADA1 n=1 Tax=Cryptococcus wingfieldii CBS 7118 TaxID=1295528 RepID=A0A1E3HEQ4_9TREE|nr:hypothetical protein L198_08257 [Cryptococcus wingfieldii CBS 7118]ODN74236.1 hypothetical protein L198_08257 [Cryptococcus wingfieldii CBS 7118]
MASTPSALPGPSRMPLQPTPANISHPQAGLPIAQQPNGHQNARPFTGRHDIHQIKQELHDALGEEGLPYWKSLNAYLLGQLGRGELEGMVRGWLKGDGLHLHNKLLSSLLSNASISLGDSGTVSASRKRKGLSVDHADYDTDDTIVEPKRRVEGWVMGLGKKERVRVKKALASGDAEKGPDGKDAWESMEQKRWSPYSQNSLIAPLAVPKRQLPSSHQLSLRLSQYAKLHDVTVPPSSTDDIGEFLAVGMDAHMADILHSTVHLTARDRPGDTGIRVPKGIGSRKEGEPQDAGEVPAPDLDTFRTLFDIHPHLHSNLSPALHRLQTSHTLAELEGANPLLQPTTRVPQWVPVPNAAPVAKLVPVAEGSKAVGRSPARSVAVQNELLEKGLLKLDKGREGDGAEGGKKEKRHTLHWRYEDPALILGDILG